MLHVLTTEDWGWWIAEQASMARDIEIDEWIADTWSVDTPLPQTFVRAVLLALAVARAHPDRGDRRYTGVNPLCRWVSRKGAICVSCTSCPGYQACTAPMPHENALYNNLVKLYTRAYNKLSDKWKSLTPKKAQTA